MSKLMCLWFALSVFCFAVPVFGAELSEMQSASPPSLSLGIGAEFESGSYGSGSTVETWRIPLLVQWTPQERVGLILEIPYLHQSGGGETVLLGGRRMTLRDSGMGGRRSSVSETRSGLGDITLDVDVKLLLEDGATPRVSVLAYAKLPTADRDKGLGTGEFDWGAGLGIGKTFGVWALRGKALYVLPGSSALYDASAYWDWSVGLGYLGGTELYPELALSGGTAAFAGEDGPLELTARLDILNSERTSLGLYLKGGLNDASPDWGSGVFIYLDF